MGMTVQEAMRLAPLDQVVHHCGFCKRSFTRREWMKLPGPAAATAQGKPNVVYNDDGSVDDWRDCDSGDENTMVRTLNPNDPIDWAELHLLLWGARAEVAEKKRVNSDLSRLFDGLTEFEAREP